jgi:hypothetical protein
MSMSFTLEVSQPCGATYRLGLGCKLHLKLAWVIAAISRLF